MFVSHSNNKRVFQWAKKDKLVPMHAVKSYMALKHVTGEIRLSLQQHLCY